jgi:hypothetical protein
MLFQQVVDKGIRPDQNRHYEGGDDGEQKEMEGGLVSENPQDNGGSVKGGDYDNADPGQNAFYFFQVSSFPQMMIQKLITDYSALRASAILPRIIQNSLLENNRDLRYSMNVNLVK